MTAPAPELTAGLRRLKLATMRQLATEPPVTAKPSVGAPRNTCAPS
jgi:hypothetical protein